MLNQSVIQNITDSRQFINVAHSNLTVPNLIIFYAAYLFFFLIFGLMIANKENMRKFWALYFLVSIILGAVLLAQIFLPNIFYDIISKYLS